MKKLLTMGLALVGALALVGTASAATADQLQPASTITYSEEVVVNNTLRASSVHIGSTEAGVGGVTYFNGSIVNAALDDDGNSTIPITIADDMRVDGEIYRTEKGGSSPLKISDSVIPTMNNTNDFGSSSNRWQDLYTVNADVSGTLTVADLSGDEIVGSANLASGAVTSAKINDDAVTPNKIEGNGGANLPIAYGLVASDTTLLSGTSNVTSVVKDSFRYLITIDGIDNNQYDYPVVVTPALEAAGMISQVTYSGDEGILVVIRDNSFSAIDNSFSFVVYPDPSAN